MNYARGNSRDNVVTSESWKQHDLLVLYRNRLRDAIRHPEKLREHAAPLLNYEKTQDIGFDAYD